MIKHFFSALILLSSLSFTDETLTHNFFGYGEEVTCNGVDISASYIMDVAGNVSGGVKQGVTQAGSLGLNINFDLDHLLNWPGCSFFNSWVFRSGESLSQEKIYNQFAVQQVYGGQNLRLNEFYFMKAFEKCIFKMGRLDAGNDFLVSPLYCAFMNNGFCGNPVSVFYNGPFSAYPNSQWAAYLSIKPSDSLIIKFGIYNTNDSVSENHYHGFDWSFSNNQGAQLITEWDYLYNQGENPTGLPGNYKAGFFWYTRGFYEYFGDGSSKGNYGYYFLADQTIYQLHSHDCKFHHDECPDDAVRGLTPFIALLFAPKDKNQFPFFGAGGLVFQGPFSSRPKDTLSLGYLYGSYSSDLRELERMFDFIPQTSESVIELNYNFQVNDWFNFMPDLQYIINPFGLGEIKNAFVIGFQLNVNI